MCALNNFFIFHRLSLTYLDIGTRIGTSDKRNNLNYEHYLFSSKILFLFIVALMKKKFYILNKKHTKITNLFIFQCLMLKELIKFCLTEKPVDKNIYIYIVKMYVNF